MSVSLPIRGRTTQAPLQFDERGPHAGVKVHGEYKADFTIDCDVLVVGSGPGGAVVAKELAEAGRDVVLLEEGPPFGKKDFVQEAGEAMHRMLREGGTRATRGNMFIPTMQANALGGGSLTGALYLGVLAGYQLLWVQLVAMGMGVIMLSAIAYVTLSTGKRPFQAIKDHINPVLAWSWAIATLMANIVWCLPQFSLGVAAVRQNLLPGLVGLESGLSETTGKAIVAIVLLAVLKPL